LFLRIDAAEAQSKSNGQSRCNGPSFQTCSSLHDSPHSQIFRRARMNWCERREVLGTALPQKTATACAVRFR
jgi:hypothetical protein